MKVVCSCGQGYVAEIASTSSTYCIKYLLSYGTTSDQNEPRSTNCGGYSTIQFVNGYSTNSGSINTCTGPGANFDTQTTNVQVSGLQVTIGTYTSISGSASFSTSSNQSYTYSFSSGGLWDYTQLGSVSGSAWAFDYIGC